MTRKSMCCLDSVELFSKYTLKLQLKMVPSDLSVDKYHSDYLTSQSLESHHEQIKLAELFLLSY